MHEENIEIGRYIKLLKFNFLKIIIITALIATTGTLLSFLLNDMYKSSAVLMPTSSSDSGLSSSLGGMASMIGVDIGNDNSDKTKLGNQILISLDFYKKLTLKDKELVKKLVAIKKFDKKQNRTFYNTKIFNPANSKWQYYGKDNNKAPTLQDTHGDFLNIISFNQDVKSKFVTVSVVHKSPSIAHEILKNIIDGLNEEIRKFDNDQAKKSLEFIEEKSANISSANFRKTINEMYNAQLHKLMLTEVSNDYAFRIIETPVVPEKKYKPSRLLVLMFSSLLGFFLSIAYVIVFKNND